MPRHGLPTGANTRAWAADDDQPGLTRALARVLALTCALLALAASPAFAARAKPTEAVASDFYGVNAGGALAGNPAGWDAQLATMQQAGIGLVRNDAAWQTAEPDAPVNGVHAYRWDRFDAIAAALARHGIRWYPIIDYSAGWASSVPGELLAPPARDEDYVAYARAFAARYGRGGSFWVEHPDIPALPVQSYEIWNEPNFAQF